jgi:hypothetical protein
LYLTTTAVLLNTSGRKNEKMYAAAMSRNE